MKEDWQKIGTKKGPLKRKRNKVHVYIKVYKVFYNLGYTIGFLLRNSRSRSYSQLRVSQSKLDLYKMAISVISNFFNDSISLNYNIFILVYFLSSCWKCLHQKQKRISLYCLFIHFLIWIWLYKTTKKS